MAIIGNYDGPLGGLEPELARRRIAVGVDDRGQICLVRPDSVVLQYDSNDHDAMHAIEERVLKKPDTFEVLGRTEPVSLPPGGVLATRLRRTVPRPPPPTRWPATAVDELIEMVAGDEYTVGRNHVYLAQGVTEHFGRVDDRRSTGTPGVVHATSAASTARPAAPPAPFPSPLGLPGHHRPNVLVLDSGLRTHQGNVEHPALDSCVVHKPWLTRATTRFNDEDEFDDDGGGRLDAQAGHGTFISGIIRRICPDAVIHHRGVLCSYGDGDDASIEMAIGRAVADLHDEIDIVVMSFGTYGEGDQPAEAMTKALARLPATSLVVAAAGNDATSRLYYPAALPGVVAVGALDKGDRALFSNFGSWVDACAPGVGLVSTFFLHFDERDDAGEPLGQWRGWASWSGTSFAAPVVAARIAQEQYLSGGDAHEAWGRLSASATFRLPDLGAVING